MKLWYSFTKELKLASKSFYFYMEVFMAVFFLAILLTVIPENFNTKSTEYLFIDLPEMQEQAMMDAILDLDLDGESEEVVIKSSGDEIDTLYYETEDKKIYITLSEADLIQLAETEKKLSAKIYMEADEMKYDYYLQGYESEKLQTLYKVIHNKGAESLEDVFDEQKVVTLSEGHEALSDRQNVLPVFLAFNGALMGMFIVAAYIFLDKQEGIVTAYAVTASKVWVYLMSKVGVLLTTSVVTSMVLVIPVMGLQANYPMLLLFLICGAVFSSSLGLVIASFYDNIMQAFGVIYAVMIAMMLPAFSYFIPGWSPVWMPYIPSYYFLQTFKEAIIKDGDAMYILYSSLGFLAVGLLLFTYANYRYKKTLTVSA